MVSVQRFMNLENVVQEEKGHQVEVPEEWPQRGEV